MATVDRVPGFFDKNTSDIEVIVSDVPLDARALADQFVRAGMAKEGKLHAFYQHPLIRTDATPPASWPAQAGHPRLSSL